MGAPLSTGDQPILKRRISARWCTLSTLGSGASRVATMRWRTASGRPSSAACASTAGRRPGAATGAAGAGSGAASRRRQVLALEFNAVFLVGPLGVGAEHAPVFLAVGI